MTTGLGDWIVEQRRARGWTQMDLAQRVPTQTSSVSRWERGICEPRGSVFRKLCAALGVSIPAAHEAIEQREAS